MNTNENKKTDNICLPPTPAIPPPLPLFDIDKLNSNNDMRKLNDEISPKHFEVKSEDLMKCKIENGQKDQGKELQENKENIQSNIVVNQIKQETKSENPKQLTPSQPPPPPIPTKLPEINPPQKEILQNSIKNEQNVVKQDAKPVSNSQEPTLKKVPSKSKDKIDSATEKKKNMTPSQMNLATLRIPLKQQRATMMRSKLNRYNSVALFNKSATNLNSGNSPKAMVRRETTIPTKQINRNLQGPIQVQNLEHIYITSDIMRCEMCQTKNYERQTKSELSKIKHLQLFHGIKDKIYVNCFNIAKAAPSTPVSTNQVKKRDSNTISNSEKIKSLLKSNGVCVGFSIPTISNENQNKLVAKMFIDIDKRELVFMEYQNPKKGLCKILFDWICNLSPVELGEPPIENSNKKSNTKNVFEYGLSIDYLLENCEQLSSVVFSTKYESTLNEIYQVIQTFVFRDDE